MVTCKFKYVLSNSVLDILVNAAWNESSHDVITSTNFYLFCVRKVPISAAGTWRTTEGCDQTWFHGFCRCGHSAGRCTIHNGRLFADTILYHNLSQWIWSDAGYR